MLVFLIISFGFLLCGRIIPVDSTTEDIVPSQDLACSDENLSKVAQENEALKGANEILKIRLELQQLSFERQLMKMQCNETKKDINSEALIGTLKTLGEQFLTKFDTLVNLEQNNSLIRIERVLTKFDDFVNVIKDQESLEQNNSLIRSEKLLEKLDNLEKGLKDQGDLEKNISLNRNNELLDVLNQISLKLTKEENSSNENPVQKPSNCAKALMKIRESGIYTIEWRNYRLPFNVYCEAKIFAGDWTVIQRRQDGSVVFDRNWTEYKSGFGDLNGEFFIGLDKLHALTTDSQQELLIELEDFEGEIRYAKYDKFAIGDESEDYKLKVLGSYSGDAGDSFTYHKNMKFSTKDRDNDKSAGNSAKKFKGGWWFNNSHYSNLNGFYMHGKHAELDQGVAWYGWKGWNYSLKRVQMFIRPKIF